MENKNDIEETFEKMDLEELKNIFDNGKDDLNDKNNIFLKCQISKQEALNGCTKEIKYNYLCEDGKKENNIINVKIPKEIKNNQSIIFYGDGNYIKGLNKRSNVIIKIEINELKYGKNCK